MRLFKNKRKKDIVEAKINGKNYKFEGISIEKWYEVVKLYSTIDIDTDEKIISIVSLLLDAKEDVVKTLTPNELEMLWNILYAKFVAWNSESKLSKDITLEGVKYRMVDIKNISIGELAYIKILQTMPNSLHKFLSVIYRPIKRDLFFRETIEKYDLVKIQAREDLFKKVDMKVLYGAHSFFLNLTYLSVREYLISLVKQKKMKKEEAQAFLNLVIQSMQYSSGESSSMSLQEKRTVVLQKLQNSIIQKHLTNLLSLSEEMKENVNS